MSVYLISDTHFNHDNIATYCDRPRDFTDIILRNWRATVRPEDLVIHLGDVLIGKRTSANKILSSLPGRKVLVRGNHDQHSGCSWWMDNGFDFACDAMVFRRCWLTHKPSGSLPEGCDVNIHGHLHNIWHGFAPDGPSALKIYSLRNPWQRLFAIEYTGYSPVEFQKFLANAERYQSAGPGGELLGDV